MIELLIVLALIGVVAYILVSVVPMPEPFPKLVVAAACLFGLLILLRAFGVDLAVPRLR